MSEKQEAGVPPYWEGGRNLAWFEWSRTVARLEAKISMYNLKSTYYVALGEIKGGYFYPVYDMRHVSTKFYSVLKRSQEPLPMGGCGLNCKVLTPDEFKTSFYSRPVDAEATQDDAEKADVVMWYKRGYTLEWGTKEP